MNDAVRLRFIEALARRASAHEGEVRRMLDARVAALRAAPGDDIAQAGRGGTMPADAPGRSALAALLDRLPARDALGEPTALGDVRSLWSRLSAERRLTQSLATVPKNAGPLNSQQLLHRSLTLMRELSPQYLERFMSHVDTLLWLDQVNRGASTGKEAPRATRTKRQSHKPGVPRSGSQDRSP